MVPIIKEENSMVDAFVKVKEGFFLRDVMCGESKTITKA